VAGRDPRPHAATAYLKARLAHDRMPRDLER
jgi:hypothetical protein